MTRPEQSPHAQQASAAGTAITRLHRDHYGRGASTTRVVYQRNFLTVYLEDIYTTAERTLIDAGGFEIVKNTRQAFQMTMRKPFSDAVEQATGRPVIAFMSQVHINPDMAAEIFVLKPTEADTAAAGLQKDVARI
ncbi:MAG TPA: Na-translocating system protein MpsC family protein [Gaiellaceae bacterium]